MNKTNMTNHLLVLILLLGVTLACAEKKEILSCGNNPFLNNLLDAQNERDFSELLMQHGPVQQEEMPCILKRIDSWSDKKRLFAAKLLVIVHGDEAAIFEAEKKVVLETNDVPVWAQIMDSLIYLNNPNLAELAAKRQDLINKALKYQNNNDKVLQGKVQSIGLKTGVLAKLPGIEDEIIKRLDSNDSELISVALDAMLPETTRSQLPKLMQMLAEYESGKQYTGFKNTVFASLIDAIIRTEDEKAFAAAMTALEKGLTDTSQVGGTRDEFEDFRNKIVFVNAPYVRKFCFYLLNNNSLAKRAAFDILTTPVWSNSQQATKEVVKRCVELIQSSNLSTDKRKHWEDKNGQTECEEMFYFLETGKNPIGGEGEVKHGTDALTIGQKWLKEH